MPSKTDWHALFSEANIAGAQSRCVYGDRPGTRGRVSFKLRCALTPSMNTRISHIFAWAHPRTAEVAVRGRALRGFRPCGLVTAAPPLLSLARAIRRSSTVLLLVLGFVFSWHHAQSQTFPRLRRRGPT